jgi:hypothetical protein
MYVGVSHGGAGKDAIVSVDLTAGRVSGSVTLASTYAGAGTLRQGAHHFVAARQGHILGRAQHAMQSLTALLDRFQVQRLKTFQTKVTRIKRVTRAAAYRFNDRVVPHAATFDEAGSDKESTRETIRLKHGHRVVVVVGIAVVEGDAHGPGRQAFFAQRAYGGIKRQHLEPGFEPAADVIETLAVGFVGEQRVRLRMHAVEDGNRELAACACGGQR